MSPLTQPELRPDGQPPAGAVIRYGGGWHDWEKQDVIPFRWMSGEAEIFAAVPGSPDTRCLALVVRHPFADQPAPRLEVFLDGRSLGLAVVPTRFATLFFPFTHAAGGELAFTLRLDRTHSAPGDGRALGVMVRDAGVIAAAALDEPAYGAGWYGWETEGYSTFRWMGRHGEILLPWDKVRAHRYLTLPVFLDFPDIDQRLTVAFEGQALASWSVIQGWDYGSVDLAALQERYRPESGVPLVLDLERGPAPSDPATRRRRARAGHPDRPPGFPRQRGTARRGRLFPGEHADELRGDEGRQDHPELLSGEPGRGSLRPLQYPAALRLLPLGRDEGHGGRPRRRRSSTTRRSKATAPSSARPAIWSTALSASPRSIPGWPRS